MNQSRENKFSPAPDSSGAASFYVIQVRNVGRSDRFARVFSYAIVTLLSTQVDPAARWEGSNVGTTVYYFFCHACGGDTASYELSLVCPYCRAGRRDFQLVGETGTQEQRAQIQHQLEELRAQWIARRRSAIFGERPPKRRWLSRQ
jgi:hypothetical protein